MEDPKNVRINDVSKLKKDIGDDKIEVTKYGALKRDRQSTKPKAPMPEIFKVQRSLASSESEPKILVYNESRSIIGEFPATKEWLDYMNGREKIYVIGTPDPKGQLIIESVISDQPW